MLNHFAGPLTALGLSLAATLPAAAFDPSAMTPEERAAFQTEIRNYLMENPQVIMEAVAVLEERQQAEQAAHDVALVQTYHQLIFEDGHSWIGGNPDGDLTLVEFMDYRCGYCRKAYDEVEELISGDGNIRFIVKEFPILGEESVLSAKFAIAAKLEAGDEAYKNAHDALISFRGKVTDDALRGLSGKLGLDTAAVMARMNSDEVSDIINTNYALAQQLSISGTPTFVLDDTMLRGYLPLDSMREMVNDARADG